MRWPSARKSHLRPTRMKLWFAATFLSLVLFFVDPTSKSLSAQTALHLPDAPAAAVDQTTSQNAPAPATGQSGTQTSPPANPAPPMTPEEQRKVAQEQLDQEYRQRVWAVVATFNTTANQKAVPLSPGQKYQLFFKSASDPWPFLLASVLAGVSQAENALPEYGQGVQGYAKRFGASYGDYFIGNFLGNAVLASLMREDPRYYQRGHGSYLRRALWASSGTVWCKRDNGTWGPNYANVVGNLSGAAIANVYYPQAERTVGETIGRGFSVTAQGIIGSEVIEFWPDIVRYHNRKLTEKLARQGRVPSTTPPAPAPSAPMTQPPLK
jgi:hypothetical protein